MSSLLAPVLACHTRSINNPFEMRCKDLMQDDPHCTPDHHRGSLQEAVSVLIMLQLAHVLLPKDIVAAPRNLHRAAQSQSP